MGLGTLTVFCNSAVVSALLSRPRHRSFFWTAALIFWTADPRVPPRSTIPLGHDQGPSLVVASPGPSVSTRTGRGAIGRTQTSRKSREKKSGKWLVRQQPERKEKYRERQCRANRKQHYKLSKPSARHDMRNANATSVTTSRLTLTDGAFAGRVKRREWWQLVSP